jgi:hypothetical protein
VGGFGSGRRGDTVTAERMASFVIKIKRERWERAVDRANEEFVTRSKRILGRL